MTDADKATLNDSIVNHLLDLDGPIRVEKTTYTDWERYVAILSTGYQEIAETLEILNDTTVLVRRFPYSGTRIERTRYLRFLISSHWNEIYILKERLVAYPKRIARFSKAASIASNNTNSLTALPSVVEDWLDPILRKRGRHVHVYRHDSRDLQKLELMTLFESINEELALGLKELQDLDYKDIRKALATEFTTNANSISSTVDSYFDLIYDAITDNDVLQTPAGYS
ncbi:MAG: hypothetical protein KZQ82_10720 [Candidatus Thiodiazotropha sp. (ex Lucinoma annulata)]|nr:hypothetical protein [Candidatus Thiodiazotropha sp. (ex Lucinoma annulata)]